MLREIRRLPEAEVIRRWIDLYVAGKHAGHRAPDPAQHLGRDSVWVEVEIPHHLYNADWNTEDAALSPAQLDRATRYALSSGPLPPGMASYAGGRRSRGRAYVSDGNHRAYAGYLRGDPTARFFMPANEWERFRSSIEATDWGLDVRGARPSRGGGTP